MSEVKIKLKPFSIPGYVILEFPTGEPHDRSKAYPSMPLKDIDRDVLSQMCDEFRKLVFEKAIKEDPKEVSSIGLLHEPPKER